MHGLPHACKGCQGLLGSGAMIVAVAGDAMIVDVVGGGEMVVVVVVGGGRLVVVAGGRLVVVVGGCSRGAVKWL